MGVQRTVRREGSGRVPVAGEQVTVHCTGYVAGKTRTRFWSTHQDDKPFTFVVGRGEVIRGWDEGVLQMRQGEVAELLMTPDFGYGARGFPAWQIPPNADLLFEVELLKIGS